MIFELKDTAKAEAFFTEHADSLIWTCLQGLMGGKVYVTDTEAPRSAMAFIAEFAFLGGEPDRELAAFKPEGTVGLVPQNERWAALIEEVWPGAYRETRYAVRKDTRFDCGKLEAIVASLPAGYEIRRLDGELYDACLESEQFEDSVMHFESKEQFLEMGRGFAVMKDGKPVSVASSYTVYRGGLEVQIATEEEERHRGLASAAGAALILSCIDDGLYPSWDAANPGSLRLAQRLGYEFDREYTAYWLTEVFDRLIADPDKSEWESFCGRYRHPEDPRRIYEIYMKDGELYYRFAVPDSGTVYDLRMYPIGERTFGINEDDFTLVFFEGCMNIADTVCKKL